MGKRKKKVRSHIRRVSRLVLEKYYADQGTRPDQATLNKMVSTIEARVTPKILSAALAEAD
jgi:hypothetical protein